MVKLRLTKIIFISLAVVLLVQEYASAQTTLSLSGSVVTGRNAGVSYTSVVLYNAVDSLMASGTVTDDHGKFVFDGIKNGNYFLQVYFVGFERAKIDSIHINGQNVFLKPLVLHRISTELDEINVVSEKGMFQSEAGKMIYNVEGNLNAVGESALELMQNIPSLGTDSDDKVTIRGAKATVLIDGVESDLSSMLDQIPADAIESIEVITNPSARYESKSGAGIVNIKLKKSAKKGYNGKIGAGIGTQKNQNFSAQLGMNLKKWKLSTSANYQKDQSEDDLLTERETLTNGQRKFMTQSRNSVKIPSSLFFRNSASYYFEEKSFVGFHYVLQDKKQKNYSDYLTDHFDADRVLSSKSSTSNEGKDHNLFNQFSSDFKKIFRNNDQHVLDISLLYSFNTPQNEYDQVNQPISVDLGSPVNKFNSDTKDYTNLIRLFKLKADYSRLITAKWKLEMGSLFSLNQNFQDLVAVRTSYVQNSPEEGFVEISRKQMDSEYDYYGYGIGSYGLVSGGFGNFRLSTGLRLDVTINESQSTEKITSTFAKLIPSIHFKHQKSAAYSWEISYTSRILPPNSRQLNPISLSWGEYLKSAGNPKLKPEVFSQAELANHWIGSKSNYSLTFFAKNRSDIIGKWYYIELDEAGREVTNSVNENLGSIFSSGVDANAMISMKQFILRPAISTFYQRINGDKFGPELDRDEISVLAKFTGDYKISNDLTLQLSGRYNSPVIAEDGKRFSYYSFDAGFKANLLQRKVSLSLKVVDIFDTMEYKRIVNQRINYTSTSFVDPHSFLLYFELAYKFNSMKAGALKSKPIKK